MRTSGIMLAGIGGFLLAGGWLWRRSLANRARDCAAYVKSEGIEPPAGTCEPESLDIAVATGAAVVGGFSVIAGSILAIRG